MLVKRCIINTFPPPQKSLHFKHVDWEMILSLWHGIFSDEVLSHRCSLMGVYDDGKDLALFHLMISDIEVQGCLEWTDWVYHCEGTPHLFPSYVFIECIGHTYVCIYLYIHI